jgi:hypothetical protein
MLDPRIVREPVGVLMLANTLAIEYYSGTPLRDLVDYRQLDLVQEAKDRLERYKEQ